MPNWTRNDSIQLGQTASQLGFTLEESVEALRIGGRLWAHGFTGYEIDAMIRWQYQQWAEDEKAVKDGDATITQSRRWWERKKRND